MTTNHPSTLTRTLVASLALSAILPAAVVTSGFVQNKVTNWSQETGASELACSYMREMDDRKSKL